MKYQVAWVWSRLIYLGPGSNAEKGGSQETMVRKARESRLREVGGSDPPVRPCPSFQPMTTMFINNPKGSRIITSECVRVKLTDDRRMTWNFNREPRRCYYQTKMLTDHETNKKDPKLSKQMTIILIWTDFVFYVISQLISLAVRFLTLCYNARRPYKQV